MTELNVRHRVVHPAHADDRLTSAIAANLGGAPRDELRRAVAVYVEDAKRIMTPPQDVIAAIKAQVQRDAQPHMLAGDYPRFMSLVVGWAIEEYYER